MVQLGLALDPARGPAPAPVPGLAPPVVPGDMVEGMADTEVEGGKPQPPGPVAPLPRSTLLLAAGVLLPNLTLPLLADALRPSLPQVAVGEEEPGQRMMLLLPRVARGLFHSWPHRLIRSWPREPSCSSAWDAAEVRRERMPGVGDRHRP